jgi:predicted acetyltransferase
MQIELEEAGESDARLIQSLLDAYLGELSTHRDIAVGATDSASYRYLDAYWSEPGRHAFLIRAGGLVVGFAFVRGPISTKCAVHELSEFYVKPESRRLGVGRRAVGAIWSRFPGEWELQVHARNSAAIRFWASRTAAEANSRPQVHEVQARDGERIQFNFRVEKRPTPQ